MAALPVSCVLGNLTTTGFTAVIMSLSGNEVTLTCGGVDYPITMAKLGEDRTGNDDAGEDWACYYGTQTVTSLTQFTKYTWTATQDGNTDNGFITTSPSSKASKFSLFPATCMSPAAAAVDATAWDLVQDDIDDVSTPPMLACLFSDDIYYSDKFKSGLVAGDINSQGKKFETGVGVTPQSQYDCGLMYAMWFGILEPFYSPGTPETLKITAAESPAFRYCIKRMAFMPQWGDHEFYNNLGWLGGGALTDYPNPYHLDGTTGLGLGTSKVIWDTIMKPLQGETAQSADTDSNHWYADFGCFRYLSMDATTKAVATVSVYGTEQIEDILDKAAEGGQWFTGIGNPAGAGRTPATYEANTQGFTYKKENYIESEHQRLWLDDSASPASLLNLPQTNGSLGSVVMWRGDWHTAVWMRYYAEADTGIVAENIHEIGLSTINTSNAGGQYLGGDQADLDTDKVEMLTTCGKRSSLELIPKPHNCVVTIVAVDGTLDNPEMVIKQWNVEKAVGYDSEQDYFNDLTTEIVTDYRGSVWRVMGSRRFVRFAGNEGYELDDEDIFQITKLSGAGDK